MPINNPMSHGKAQASAIARFFCRKERIKNLGQIFWRYAGTVILNSDLNLIRGTVFSGVEFDDPHAIGHGLGRVPQEIEDHFLELLSICIDIQIL